MNNMSDSSNSSEIMRELSLKRKTSKRRLYSENDKSDIDQEFINIDDEDVSPFIRRRSLILCHHQNVNLLEKITWKNSGNNNVEPSWLNPILKRNKTLPPGRLKRHVRFDSIELTKVTLDNSWSAQELYVYIIQHRPLSM